MEIIEEEMGLGKKIARFEKGIDRLEKRNQKIIVRSRKDEENKLKIVGLVKLLRHNLKSIKLLNDLNKEDFYEEDVKKIKFQIKKMISDQKKTMDTLKDPAIVKYLKGIGLGIITGGLIAGISYFFNKLAMENPVKTKFLNHESSEVKLMPGGLITGIIGLNRKTFDKYTPEDFMKFSAAEAGAWTGLLAAKNMKDYYDDGYNISIYNSKKEEKKEIKENYSMDYLVEDSERDYELSAHRTKMDSYLSKTIEKNVKLFLSQKGIEPSIKVNVKIIYNDKSRDLSEFPSQIRLELRSGSQIIRVIDFVRKGNKYKFYHNSRDSRKDFFSINDLKRYFKGNSAEKLDNTDAEELLRKVNESVLYVIKHFAFKNKKVNDIRISSRENNAYRGGRPTQKMYYENYFPY